MSTRSAMVALALALAVTITGADEAAARERACGSRDPVNSIAEMSAAIYACWRPPHGTAGLSLTLRFSLRRDGTLIGKPRATFSVLGSNDALNRAFVASVLEALDKALPLPFTESMGEAIAGRILSPRFTVALERKS
ncbi:MULTISPECIES: hypothetical protein [unclassified Mesorhizobium]|uniref:hypothetical protein n=1 Tax=unclassified Mesorhizobium TaxID=325217 RepID=UPI002417346B|nr:MULTISPECIES: hypothetical protein [unclassified Mesorhizobium]MDG4902511.1 hypothetical protein [Mesorhizobium sp. WSM4962]MDG4920519.1 hypothetical protein [Mesorhizobium sp. WSM4989]